MIGYKVFNPDWTCRGFQYSVGKTFEEDVIPSCNKKGFHFCTELNDCFNCYSFDPHNKVAEIEALGEIDTEVNGSRHCTNKIKIIREISWEEVLRRVNTGKYNMGRYNAGDCNNGTYNTGDCNEGEYNSGDWNSGDCNTDNCNNGYHNSGYCNKGCYNSGNCNIGHYNSGDYNSTSFSNGCFNTIGSKFFMFNKPSNWTVEDWRCSEARRLLNNIMYNALKWIYSDEMSEEEKEQHPEHEIIGGYLKELDKLEKSKCNQLWWDSLSDYEKNVIKSLPNFDAKIFKEITGIDVNYNKP